MSFNEDVSLYNRQVLTKYIYTVHIVTSHSNSTIIFTLYGCENRLSTRDRQIKETRSSCISSYLVPFVDESENQ